MGKKGGSAPKAPDPYKTASAESQFNRLDTYSPAGSGVRHGYTDENGVFQPGVAPKGQQSAQTYIESDWERANREALEPASLDLTNRIIDDNITGMPDAPRVADRGDVAADIFNRNFSLMAPGIEQANSRLITNLQARGLPVGGEAFNDAYGEQLAKTQDTISRLAQDANIGAGQEQSRLFGLESAERQGAVSELVAAMGGGYNPPNSMPDGNAASVNYSKLVGDKYQADLASYNAQQEQNMATAGAIGSIGSALIKSTQDAKDIVGQANPHGAVQVMTSLPIYGWRYKDGQAPALDHGGQHVGPMAEDFQRLTGLGRSDVIDVTDYLGVMATALQNALQRIAMLEDHLGLKVVDAEDAAEKPRRVH